MIFGAHPSSSSFPVNFSLFRKEDSRFFRKLSRADFSSRMVLEDDAFTTSVKRGSLSPLGAENALNMIFVCASVCESAVSECALF